MAEVKARAVLEKEVTCPLCLDLFKEPKKLSCDHVYCRDCLKGLALRSLDKSISCPECRTTTDIPNNDVSDFPTAFHINRILGAFQQLHQIQEVEETDLENVTSSPQKCETHPAQTLALYCETCKEYLCRDCVLRTEEHATHKYGFFKEVADECRKKINAKFSRVKDRETSLIRGLEQVDQVQNEVALLERRSKKEIEVAFEELFSVLDKCKVLTMKHSEVHYQSIASINEHQRGQLKEELKELQVLKTSVDRCLEDEDKNVIANVDSTLRSIETLHEKIQSVPVTVTGVQPLALQMLNAEALQHQLFNECYLYNPPSPEMCTIEGLSDFIYNKEYMLTLHLCDSTGKRIVVGSSEVKVQLYALQDGSEVTGDIELASPDQVTIRITPRRRGQHKLSIEVNGFHIKRSPFKILVGLPLTQALQPRAILDQPGDIFCWQEKLIAADMKEKKIVEIDSLLNVREILKFEGVANGLIQDANCFLYITTIDDRVHKIARSGEHIKTIGAHGKGNGEFDIPNGLRISQNEELYVCDSNNHRIQILDLDLNFKRSFGRRGSGRDQLSFPTDIDFDSEGFIYVVDSSNNRIQVFSSSEQHVCAIGNQRSIILSKLSTPLGICVHNNNIYVTENGSNRVSVMTTQGEHIATFGKGHLKNPTGIAINQDGYIYVSSHNESRIVAF